MKLSRDCVIPIQYIYYAEYCYSCRKISDIFSVYIWNDIEMNPIDFIKTLYFGDRGLTKILLDLCENKRELHIDCISRVRDKSGEWKFYINSLWRRVVLTKK